MAISRSALFIALLLFFAGFLVVSAAPESKLVLSKVDRRIDLTSHVVRVLTTLKVENVGSTPVSELHFALLPEQAKSLSFARAATSEGKGKNKAPPVPLQVNAVDSDDTTKDTVLHTISLKNPLGPGETISVDLYLAYSDVLKPLPAEISQSDVQFVLYHDNAYFLSPYLTKVQVTTLKTPNNHIQSYTKLDPVKQSETELRYGPYNDAGGIAPITVHFENNRPFTVVEELEREIEISNWGSISIVENYRVLHGGAHHKGSFSRLDYQARPMASGVSSIRHLLARLPPRAHSVYYRDEIGNISTSRLRSDHKKTELELEPRFPLFGGWRVTFTIGYAVPLKDFVFQASDGRRYLNFPLGCPLHEAMVQKHIVKVVLPEGSRDPSVVAPFPVEQYQEVKYSYLDTVGRTVVVLAKENVIQEHNVPFQVYFRFSPIAMLVEPLMLVTGFFCLFAAYIAYAHFDFSISKSSASYQARLQREEILDAIQRLHNVMTIRLAVSDKLEASLRDLARTGDVQACKAVRKSADATLKETAKELKNLHESLQLSSRSSQILPKIDALIQKEKQKQEKLIQKHTVTVESYERKLSSKEIDNRIAPYQQVLVVLKQEVDEMLEALDEF